MRGAQCRASAAGAQSVISRCGGDDAAALDALLADEDLGVRVAADQVDARARVSK